MYHPKWQLIERVFRYYFGFYNFVANLDEYGFMTGKQTLFLSEILSFPTKRIL